MEQEIFSFIGGDVQWNFLKAAWKEKRVASSYIFLGPEHVGRETLAKFFVSLFFCEKENAPCRNCQHCKKILQGEHPALLIVEGNSVDVSEIRAIHEFIALKSFRADYRFILFRDFHALHRHSANALLKVFEEPPANLVFLSIAESLHGILPTIQSRSQLVRLSRSSDQCIKNMYKKYCGDKEFPTPYFLNWIEGRPGRMIDFFKNSETWEKREQIWKEVMELLFDAEEGKLPVGKSYTDRNTVKEILALCEEIGRSLYFFKIHNRTPNEFPYSEKISAFLAQKTRESLRVFLVRILKAQMLLRKNVSPLLLCDQIFSNL